MGEEPGFFGKVPARGDFLSRRVPAGVAGAWEAWLQRLTASVRESGLRQWQDAWLTAPVWHFVMGREVAPPGGAAGVMLASADRVGRLFPFTLIGAASASGRAIGAWAREAEALALGALDDDFDPATLDAALAQLGPPALPAAGVLAAGALAVGTWDLALEEDWPADGEACLAGPGQSAWWTRGSDRVGPTRLRCVGLPSARAATAMVLGGG